MNVNLKASLILSIPVAIGYMAMQSAYYSAKGIPYPFSILDLLVNYVSLVIVWFIIFSVLFRQKKPADAKPPNASASA